MRNTWWQMVGGGSVAQEMNWVELKAGGGQAKRTWCNEEEEPSELLGYKY
jgi:hypothetical protein